jgi:hypothetical protein
MTHRRKPYIEPPPPMGSVLNQEEWHILYQADSEEPVVQVIKTRLLNEEDRKWMFDHKLSIEDLLNGRYSIELQSEVFAIYERWNDRVGIKYFGILWL